jgi:hypothetical protein
MRTLISFLAVALTIASATTVSAQGTDATKYDKGSTVTIQGCVVAGEKAGTFVLTGVTETPVGHSPDGKYGPRFYWLDKTADDLKPHVGHVIQVRGVIADVEESEVEREPGGWNHGVRVAIELPGEDVLTSPRTGGIAVADRSSHKDKKITLLKLDVKALTMVALTCVSQW